MVLLVIIVVVVMVVVLIVLGVSHQYIDQKDIQLENAVDNIQSDDEGSSMVFCRDDDYDDDDNSSLVTSTLHDSFNGCSVHNFNDVINEE